MLEIVIEEVLWSIRGSNNMKSPVTNVKWHSVMIIFNDNPLLIRLYTKPSSYHRYRPFAFYWGFHRTFATGLACRQRTLTPPDTRSRPIWDLHKSACWDQSFSRTCRYFPDYELWTSLGTFSIVISLIQFFPNITRIIMFS